MTCLDTGQLAVLLTAGAAVRTGVLQRAVRASQDHLVASVVPHIPFPTPIQVRTGRGGVAGAIAGVNDGLLASSQPEAVRKCVAVTGPISYGPPGDRVRDVVAVPDHHVLGVKARVTATVGAWGVEIHLVDVDSGGGCLSRYCDQKARNSYEAGDEKNPVSRYASTLALTPMFLALVM
jgi:hypothetical protein